MPRVKTTTTTVAGIADAAAEQQIDSAVDSLFGGAPRDPNASPVNIRPKLSPGFDRVLHTVIDENLDVEQEYAYLEAELEIVEAMTPEVVRGHLNRCEKNALRAHRLFVLARAQLKRFEIDTEVALGAMRDQAVALLQVEKDSGKRSKQITDTDVREKAAALHPDEWRAISDALANAEGMLKVIERLSDVWYRRSWSLSSLNG